VDRYTHTHTHIHTQTQFIYIYIYMHKLGESRIVSVTLYSSNIDMNRLLVMNNLVQLVKGINC
jgi:hypothetical protein